MYGNAENCIVIKIHPLGTIDVQRVKDGKFFRITGLTIKHGLKVGQIFNF